MLECGVRKAHARNVLRQRAGGDHWKITTGGYLFECLRVLLQFQEIGDRIGERASLALLVGEADVDEAI